MLKNVVTGWKTTVIGVIVLAASITSVFTTASVNWGDASIGICIGLALLFCPDSILDRIRKTGNYVKPGDAPSDISSSPSTSIQQPNQTQS
jgi:hypothetical protein